MSRKDQIVNVLANHVENGLTYDEIAREIGAPTPSVRRTVAELERDQRVWMHPTSPIRPIRFTTTATV